MFSALGVTVVSPRVTSLARPVASAVMEPEPQAPDRNLAMELVRGTEAAALAAGRWMGRGDKNAADGAAVDAMRLVLNTVSMDGVVVIGEGEGRVGARPHRRDPRPRPARRSDR